MKKNTLYIGEDEGVNEMYEFDVCSRETGAVVFSKF